MILTDLDIRHAMEDKLIIIEPFDVKALGTNSYDVHLSNTLLTYDVASGGALDCKVEPTTKEHTIGYGGFVLQPGELYLASTDEYTESHRHVPFLEGKSSLGRLGLSIHITAGKGDVGFCNHWTMEMTVVKPLRIYAGMPIGQLIWFNTAGKPDTSYRDKRSAKYNNRDPRPQASRMHLNFSKET